MSKSAARQVLSAVAPIDGQDVAEFEAWPEPQDLPDKLEPVEPFDPALLPGALRPWLTDVAERMQVPLDLVAVPAVVALGALIGRQVTIRPKAHDGWTVVPNLWGGVIARPSMMKSGAIAEATRPLNRLVAEAAEAHREALAEHEIVAELADARRAARRKAIHEAARKGDADAMEDLARDVVPEPEPPALRRYMVMDATTEKIADLLADNPNGLLVLRDELTGWLKSLDKDGRETDRAFYLEGWNGIGGFVVDRIGRGTLHVPALTLSVLGGIQPGPLRDYVYQATRDGAGADGLLQRFQMLVYPDEPTGRWQNVDRRPNADARDSAFEIFRRLDTLTPIVIGAVRDDGEDLAYLRFDEPAQAVFDAWRDELENDSLRAGELSPALESHFAKYRSLMPSLALIIHLTEWASGSGVRGAVTERAARMAAAWCDYLAGHARRLYGAVDSAHLDAARNLLKRLKAGDVVLTEGAFKLQGIYLKGWSRLSTPDEVRRAVEILEGANWVRQRKRQHAKGGRPAEDVLVHPQLLGRDEK